MVSARVMLPNDTKVAQLVLAHHAFVRALAFPLAPWPGLVDDISQQVFLEFLAKQRRQNLELDARRCACWFTEMHVVLIEEAMNMINAFLKRTLIVASAAAAITTYSADNSAAATFKPQAIPADLPTAGLQLWLSASQVEQTGGVITLIKDLSGNENHARRTPPSAAPATNPALVKDTVSGQPVLRFSGATIAFGFQRLSDIRTAFWVVSKDPPPLGSVTKSSCWEIRSPTISTPVGRTTRSSIRTLTLGTFPNTCTMARLG